MTVWLRLLASVYGVMIHWINSFSSGIDSHTDTQNLFFFLVCYLKKIYGNVLCHTMQTVTCTMKQLTPPILSRFFLFLTWQGTKCSKVILRACINPLCLSDQIHRRNSHVQDHRAPDKQQWVDTTYRCVAKTVEEWIEPKL